MSDQTLTTKQLETLKKIEDHIYSNGFSPTMAELKNFLDVSSNQSVINHLDALEEKGYIRREKKARGIRIIKESQRDKKDGEFMDILNRVSKNITKTEKKVKNQILFSNPYAANDTSGQIIYGEIDNEKY